MKNNKNKVTGLKHQNSLLFTTCTKCKKCVWGFCRYSDNEYYVDLCTDDNSLDNAKELIKGFYLRDEPND